MSVNIMEKVWVVGHNSVRTPLLDVLQQIGSVQVTDLTPNTEIADTVRQPLSLDTVSSSEVNDILAELDYLINFLTPFRVQESLLTSLSRGKKRVTQKEISRILNDYKKKDIYGNVRSIARRLSDNTKNINALRIQIQSIDPWLSLNIPLEELKSTRLTKIIPIKANADIAIMFRDEAQNALKYSQIYSVSEGYGAEYLILIVLEEDKEIAEAILGRFGLEKTDFTGLTGAPSEVTKQSLLEIKRIEQEQAELQDNADRIAQCLSEIHILHDFFSNQKEKINIQNFFGDTRETFFLEGWVQARDKGYVKRVLESRFNGVCIRFCLPEEGVEPPVALNNSSMVAPFEGLTKLYGMPRPGEADPTPFLAPFFFIFFGLCLTDAGYGLVLTLLAAFALKKFVLSPEKRNMVKLALFCGISTIIAGAITGSWFGDLAEQSGWTFLVLLKNFIVVFDPIKQPMVFFVLAISLGVIQVVFGIGVEFWDLWRHGRSEEAVFEQLPWLFFFAGLILLVPVYIDPLIFPIAFLAKGLIWGGLIVLLLFGGRKQRNPFKRFGMGLLKIYGIIGYFSDILSYSRLLALGLATAAVANVINKIAFMTSDVPVVGYLLMVVLLAGGHIYNMLINFLGASIHSLRLQFVEFFPKFFEGGGKIFSPFRKIERYSVLVEEAPD